MPICDSLSGEIAMKFEVQCWCSCYCGCLNSLIFYLAWLSAEVKLGAGHLWTTNVPTEGLFGCFKLKCHLLAKTFWNKFFGRHPHIQNTVNPLNPHCCANKRDRALCPLNHFTFQDKQCSHITYHPSNFRVCM